MSFSGILTSERVAVGARPSPVFSTNGETFDAALNYMRTNQTSDAAIRLTGDAYRERDNKIRKVFNQDPFDITGIKKKYTNPSSSGRVKMVKENQKLLDQWILQGRKDNPEKFNDIMTSQEVEESAKNKARLSKKQYDDILSRNPNGVSKAISSFSGGIVGGFADPLNLATLPLGAGAGRSILQAALIEGVLNAGVEAATQPFVAQWQKELGYKYGLTDAVQNVSFAFAGGAAFSTALRGSIPAIRKAYEVTGSVSQTMLSRIADSERIPPSVRSAASYMSRVAHIDESAPPGMIKTDRDLVEHRERVRRASEDFENYKEPNFTPRNKFEEFVRDPLRLQDLADRLEAAKRYKPTKDTKKPLVNFLKEMGGVRVGSKLDNELRNMGINPKTAPGLFKKDAGRGDIDNIVAEEFDARFETVVERDGDYVSREFLLEALRDESFGKTVLTKEITAEEDFIEELNKRGIDVDRTTPEEVYDILNEETDEIINIRKAAEQRGGTLTVADAQQVKRLMDNNPAYDAQDALDEHFERMAIIDEAYDLKVHDPVPPLERVPEGVNITDIDRMTSKQSAFKELADQEPDFRFIDEDGTEISIKDLAARAQEDQAVLDALTTCRLQ